MNCSQVEILPKDSEIDQLRKELFQARCDVGYYKDLHSRNVAMRERKQYEHDAKIRKLKKKYQTEIGALQELIAKLQVKEELGFLPRLKP